MNPSDLIDGPDSLDSMSDAEFVKYFEDNRLDATPADVARFCFIIRKLVRSKGVLAE